MGFIEVQIFHFDGSGWGVDEVRQGSDVDGAVVSLSSQDIFDSGHRMTSNYNTSHSIYSILYNNTNSGYHASITPLNPFT
jgi:hypothetical protein